MDELLSSIDVGDVGEDTTKADRMRNAFLESKESYEHELVVTPPGVSHIHCHQATSLPNGSLTVVSNGFF
jgi:hypothetical protein